MQGIPIPEPEIGILGPFQKHPRRILRYMRRNRARAVYSREFSGKNLAPIILLHLRPQPSTRTMKGIRDLVNVLNHEYLHWVLDKYEQPASTCLDHLTDSQLGVKT